MAATQAKALSTRLLLLLEIHRRRHSRLRTLAEQLGVTVQGVSLALKRLTRDRLVENRAGVWRPTPLGTEAIHGSMRDLRRFVDDALGELRLIDETVAQADARMKPGDEVGLYMRDGRLRAAPRVYAGSHGTARSRGRRGELVRVADLHGIVALKPGRLTFVSHPETPTPSQWRRARGLLGRRGASSGARLGAHGLASAVLLERLGRSPDFEFAPLPSALDAVRRGVEVQYWVTAADLPGCLAAVAHANGSGPQSLAVRSVEI